MTFPSARAKARITAARSAWPKPLSPSAASASRSDSGQGFSAPVFGRPSARADATEGMNALIAAMVGQSARAIEAAWFRAAFPGARIVVAGDGVEALVAVDRDDLAIGATRAARRALGLPKTGALKPRPLSDLLAESLDREAGAGGLDRAERAAVIRALARTDGNVTAAARALGVGRATLYRRMSRLGIAPVQGPRPGSETVGRGDVGRVS